MARTIPRNTSDRASPPATHATATGRVAKNRSDQSHSRSSRVTRQRSHMLQAASSSGVLQNAVDEVEDATAGGSSKNKGKGKSRVLEEDVIELDSDADDDHGDRMDSILQGEEDVDMQQALMDSLPPNDICPTTDKNDKPFRIMELPTEIRLEIYRACLTRPYDILLSKRDKPRRQEDDLESEQNDLLLSDDQSDNEDTESEHQAVMGTALQAAATNSSSSSGRSSTNSSLHTQSTLTHGNRRTTSRTARPIRLSSSRSNPRPQTDRGHVRAGSRFRRAISRAGEGQTRRVRHVSVPVNEPPRNQSQDPLLVNILRVSKDVYKEARSVLYNENKFNLDLNTAMSTLSLLHQRSRRQIKHVELEIPTYNEILERFQETVRLSLRYCTGLKTFVIHMPFTLPGADGSGTTGNTTVYANGFDILRWLPQECNIILKGNICTEIEVVVNKHQHLAKTLDKVSHQSLQYRPWMQGQVQAGDYQKVFEETDKENIHPSLSSLQPSSSS